MNNYFSLTGKVVVITGGGSGIGLATAKRFAASGAKVVIGDLSDASALANELGGIFVKTNVTQEDQVEQLMQAAVDHFGRLDILVNSAGVFSDYKALTETTREDYQFCFDVNTLGVAFGIKHAASRISKGGAIINVASMAAKKGVVSISSYVASKFAVVGLTQTAALELAEQKIRVNCVCPSTVDTPMMHAEGGDDFTAGLHATVPLGRVCEAEEVSAMIHFMAADDCGYLNGQAINLCGGASAGLHQRALDKLAQ